MTDNEKRAHDLAVASVPLLYDVFIKRVENYVEDTGELRKEYIFNVFEEYLNAYNLLLKEFEAKS